MHIDTLTSRNNAVHEMPDHDRPETWIWKPTITFRQDGTNQITNNPTDIRKTWNAHSEKVAEPFRSALLSLPADATIWCERLSQWPTEAWDNKQATVTLAGDAAHPMTYRKQHTIPSTPPYSAHLSQAQLPFPRSQLTQPPYPHQIAAKASTTPSTTPPTSAALSPPTAAQTHTTRATTANPSRTPWRRTRRR